MAELKMTTHSTHKTSPKWSFSAKVPTRELLKGNPGPGEYKPLNTDKDKFKTAPAFSIAAGGRDGKEWNALPGPGAYTPGLQGKDPPKWAFTSDSRLKEIKRSATPGPDKYDIRGNLEGLKFSVSSRPSKAKLNQSPGPNQYKINYDQCFESSMKSSFGSSSRSELVPSKTPGPGQYELMKILGGNCTVRSMPSFTISGKRPNPKTDQTPGPGAAPTQFHR
jgi:hypothetical protein